MIALPLALLIGCLPQAAQTETPASAEHYTCRAADAPTDALRYESQRPPGGVEIARLPDAASGGEYAGPRVQIRADAAPLYRVGLALADALQTPVVVAPEVAHRRVTVALAAAGPAEALRALAEAAEVSGWMEAGVLGLRAEGAAATPDAGPPEHTARIEADTPERARAAAGLYCALMSGPGDSASAVDRRAFATADDALRLEQWQGLYSFLSGVPVGDGGVFSCRGDAPEPPPRATGGPDEAGEGVISVEALPEPAERGPTGARWDERLNGVVLSVTAERAPLGALALELSEATGYGVVVHEAAADLPVTLRAHGETMGTILQVLARSLELELSLREPALLYDPARASAKRGPELSAVLLRAYPVSPPGQARALAEVYCAQAASDRGAAGAIEGALFVSDTEDRLGWVESALDDLGR